MCRRLRLPQRGDGNYDGYAVTSTLIGSLPKLTPALHRCPVPRANESSSSNPMTDKKPNPSTSPSSPVGIWSWLLGGRAPSLQTATPNSSNVPRNSTLTATLSAPFLPETPRRPRVEHQSDSASAELKDALNRVTTLLAENDVLKRDLDATRALLASQETRCDALQEENKRLAAKVNEHESLRDEDNRQSRLRFGDLQMRFDALLCNRGGADVMEELQNIRLKGCAIERLLDAEKHEHAQTRLDVEGLTCELEEQRAEHIWNQDRMLAEFEKKAEECEDLILFVRTLQRDLQDQAVRTVELEGARRGEWEGEKTCLLEKLERQCMEAEAASFRAASLKEELDGERMMKSRVQAQRLLDLEVQLGIAVRDRDNTEKEMASARKVWDEKEDVLLMKMDELRAKIVALDGDLATTKDQSAIDKKLRLSVELELRQEKASRMRVAETVDGLNTQLKNALDEKQSLTTALDRKAESIQTGRSILVLAQKKLSDVTSVRDGLLEQVAALTTTVDALRTQSATQTSQIQALQRQLDLANTRWSIHGEEIADEELVWEDEEEVEAEKRQQEKNIRLARERLEKMPREELKQKAEQAAREQKRAEEKRAREAEDAARARKSAEDRRAREAEEETKRRAEEELRKREAERQEHEKRQAYGRWRKASADEMLRHQSISQTRFYANRGVWTNAKALNRFVELLEEFPDEPFSAERPLTFWSVPWPVLGDPLKLAPERIDWRDTEAFFLYAQKILIAERYREIVSKAQRTFHPDKWVGKLGFILDDAVRDSLHNVFNTVSQAINGLNTRR